MNAVRKSCLATLRHSGNFKVGCVKPEPNPGVKFASNRNVLATPHLRANAMFYTSQRRVHILTNDDNCNISSVEIRRTVKSQFGAYEDGHTCISVDCPSCKGRQADPTSPANKVGKLHINLRTGYTFCSTCLLEGPWSSLQSYLKVLHSYHTKLEKSACPPSIIQHLSPYTPSVAITNKMRQLWNSAQPVQSLSEDTLISFLAKMRLGDVRLKTLEEMGAKINLNLNHLILPCRTWNCDTEYQSLRILRPIPSNQVPTDYADAEQANESNIHEAVIPDENPWLLGYHLAKGEEEVLLASSAADALVARQQLSIPTLCLPSGISHLPLTTLALLEPFKKITLWLDHGAQGDEAARSFARKLNEKRCNFIRSSEATPFMMTYQSKGDEIKKVYRTAVPMVHKAITTFSSLRKEVFAEIVQSRIIAGVPWRRFPALTDLLKGHRRGELTVFTGPTGAGKTTFLSEYSLDLCAQGVRTLWGSFEIRNVRLAKTMLQQHSGVSLETEPHLFEAVADDFEKLPMYFLAFHGQQTIASVLDAMSHAVYVHDISHIVIDNLQFMMGTSSAQTSTNQDRFYRQDQIISSFRRFATEQNVHVTLVIHPRKELDELSTSSIFGGAKASQEADNIMILQEKRTHPGDPSKNRKYIQITKNRYAGDLGVMPLEFNKESLSFAPSRRMAKAQQAAPSAKKSPAPFSAKSALEQQQHTDR